MKNTYLYNFVQEREDHSHTCILLGGGHKIKVVVLNVNISNISMLKNGRHIPFLFFLHQQRHELVDGRHVDVPTIVATYQHLKIEEKTKCHNIIIIFRIYSAR